MKTKIIYLEPDYENRNIYITFSNGEKASMSFEFAEELKLIEIDKMNFMLTKQIMRKK